MEEYIVHHGIKGQRWGVRKAERSKKRGQKLVSKYGTKKAAEEVVKSRARTKQIAKKGALFLGSALAAYALKQEIHDIELSTGILSTSHWNHEQAVKDAHSAIYNYDADAYADADKRADRSRDSIDLAKKAIKNEANEAGQYGAISGALGAAGAATKINGQTRKTKRKLKDIRNA